MLAKRVKSSPVLTKSPTSLPIREVFPRPARRHHAVIPMPAMPIPPDGSMPPIAPMPPPEKIDRELPAAAATPS